MGLVDIKKYHLDMGQNQGEGCPNKAHRRHRLQEGSHAAGDLTGSLMFFGVLFAFGVHDPRKMRMDAPTKIDHPRRQYDSPCQKRPFTTEGPKRISIGHTNHLKHWNILEQPAAADGRSEDHPNT